MRLNNRGEAAGGGIGFLGLLTIVFIVMKLTGFITWSWLWVLSPIWLPIAVAGVGIILVYILGVIFHWR